MMNFNEVEFMKLNNNDLFDKVIWLNNIDGENYSVVEIK